MKSRDLVEGTDYGVQGGYYGRFRMIRLAVPGWGGSRLVLMERLDSDTGEPAGAERVFVRPQDIQAPWDRFVAERDARANAEEETRALGARVCQELSSRGIDWSFGEWRGGAHLICLGAADLAQLLGIPPQAGSSAIEELLGPGLAGEAA